MNRERFTKRSAPQSHEVIGAQLVNSLATRPADSVPVPPTRWRTVETLVDQASRTASVPQGLGAGWISHDLQPDPVFVSAPAWNELRADTWDEIHVLTMENHARVNWLSQLTAEQTADAAGRPKPDRITSDQTLTLDPQAIHAEAVDEGFDRPPAEALAGAKRVLRRFPFLHGLDTDIYPTPDAEVAILAAGSRPRASVLLQCDGDGQVRCSVSIDGRHRRALYDKESFSELRDDFITSALAELGA